MRALSFFISLAMAAAVYAQGPNNSGTYYQAADGKKGSALKTALFGIIGPHTTLSYDALWDCYKTTDKRSDGKVWDMYSNTTNYVFGTDQGGNYSKEGDSYNREHSMPKSWFSEASPMRTDLVHVIPADGYVNNRRSNYPFGETNGENYQSNNGFSKVGSCTYSGYSGTVFEPADEYKGDLARIYFYMATCYEDKISNWSSPMLAGNKYPAYTTWAINMLLEWAAADPVSQKETDRNNGVYSLQENRNPFVDYPGLEQYVWGSKQDMAFSYDNYNGEGSGTDPDTPDTPDTPTDPDTPTTPDTPVEGEQTYTLVTSAAQLETGYGYLIVCEDNNVAMAGSGKNIRNYASVTISNNVIKTTVNESGKPYQFILGGNSGAYTLYDTTEKVYLALTSSDNKLHSEESVSENSKWSITISGSNAQITNNVYSDRFINYNSSSPRFACYKSTSNQKPVAIYKNSTPSGINGIHVTEERGVDVYSISGVLIKRSTDKESALEGLSKGIYIINHKKYVVK